MIKEWIDFYKNLSSNERKFVWWFIVVLILITTTPWLYAQFIAGDLTYSGKTMIAGADKPVYYSLINQAKHGALLLKNQYTTGPQIGLISPMWLTVGWFSMVSGLSAVTSFHIFRLLFLIVFIWQIYFLLAKNFLEIIWRRVGLFVLLSSGLGVLTIFRPWTADNQFDYFGSDIWFSEGHVFNTLFHSPLFIFSHILLVWLFYWLAEHSETADYKESIVIFGLVVLLGLMHPYDLVILSIMAGIWFVYRWIVLKSWPKKLFIQELILALATALVVVYFLVMQRIDPGFGQWASQNVTLSPRLLNYLIGFAPILILAILGYKKAWVIGQWQKLFCLWSVAAWFLMYLPLNFQRRLGSGLGIALAMIGTVALPGIWSKFKFWPSFSKKLVIGVCILVVYSTPIFYLGMEYVFYTAKIFPLFLTKGYQESFDWLNKNTPPQAVILSDARVGNILPGWVNRYVYLGHAHQSADWLQRQPKTEKWFYALKGHGQDKADWLKSEGIDYVFYGPDEKKINNLDFSQANYLKLVYQNSEVEIYQVIK